MLDFIIIGAEKAGSTFVHHCLKDHPEVFMPDEEIALFEKNSFSKKRLKKVESLFKNVPRGIIKGIKRSVCLGRYESPGLIARHYPNIKIIVILRNPVDRAISAYFHQMKMGLMPVNDIEIGFNNLFNSAFVKKHLRSKDIINFGFYFKHITHYLRYFKKRQMLILNFNDLKTRPIMLMGSVYKFLDIDSNHVSSSINSRPQTGVYSIPRLTFKTKELKHLYEIEKNKKGLMFKKLSFFDMFCVVLINIIDWIVLKPILGNQKPNIPKSITNKLKSIYKKDWEKASKYL